MNAYIIPIRTAFFLFPFVALMFTLPYMAVQYRKYGSILALRTAIVYSFILYLMCAFFLVILPFPSIEIVRGLTSRTIQLIPFYQLYEVFIHSGFSITEPATYFRLFWNRDFFQLVANVVMFVPLGIYLRYFFERNARQVLLIALGISLFFELTQLSGLFFIYPRPYRLADVDDLICNTLGGMIGYWIAPLFMKILPTKERMDTVAYRRGTFVSFTRRATAALLDGLLMLLALIVWMFVDPRIAQLFLGGDFVQMLLMIAVVYGLGITLYFIFGEWLWRGETPGKRLLHIRLVDLRTGGRPRLWQCAVRYGILYFIIVPTPIYEAFLLMRVLQMEEGRAPFIALMVVLLMIYVLFWLLVLIHAFTHSIQLLHDKLSQTRNISTRVVTEEMLGEVGDGEKPDSGALQEQGAQAGHRLNE